MRHDCGHGLDWPMCVICDGRIHEEGCTTKRRPALDCCAARHQQLFARGIVRGIADDSFLMWSPEHPTGVHRGLFSPTERDTYNEGNR